MNPKVKKLWLEALRGGQYQQGSKRLRDKQDHFCVLGVLCDLYVKQRPDCRWKEMEAKSGFRIVGKREVHWCEDYLIEPVMQWAGLDSQNPLVEHEGKKTSLSSLNDNGMNFKAIAKLIEKQL
jgi:hypothetical protein